jgi:hypothetical protein
MPLQGKQLQGVTKARVGSTWRTLATVDFSAASGADWTGNARLYGRRCHAHGDERWQVQHLRP